MHWELKLKKQISFAMSLIALAGAGTAFAAQGQVKPGMDQDGNGVITRAEAQSRATALFARMDVNHDGKIDQADRALRRETMKTHMFERLDTDGNGQISKAEFMADRAPGKGASGRKDAANEGGRMGHGHGRRGGHKGGMMGMARLADANGDGAITQTEFTSAALTRFDAMDTNKDGQVTQAERQAYRAQMKTQRQQQRAMRNPG